MGFQYKPVSLDVNEACFVYRLSCGKVEALGYFQLLDIWYDHKTPATPEMKFFVTLIDRWRLQISATKSFIVDVAMVLDTSLWTQWTHLRQLSIDSTSKSHVKSPSIFYRLWKANPRGKNDIDSTWITWRHFNFQSRWNIDEFSTCFFRCRFDVERRNF